MAGMTLRLVVVGTRTFENYDLVESVLNEIIETHVDPAFSQNIEIISGGAKGADALAKRYAERHEYKYVEFPANWDVFGKKAGYIRNRQMHEYASKSPARVCTTFWDGESKGTAQNFLLAKEFKNDLVVVKYNEIEASKAECSDDFSR